MESVILAGGCFWCTETIFKSLKGVTEVIPGYSGGETTNPSYYEVANGTSGHAECVKVTFDPKVISLKNILSVFFKLHDPTTLNRQGVDVGTQYRSAIFYNNEEQKETVEKSVKLSQNDYKNKIVTEITKYKNFFPAEKEHKNFYIKNKGGLYCTLVIDPKIKKLRSEFGSIVK